MADFAVSLAQQLPRLRRYARALTHDPAWADDLVQDALERALRRRLLFRPGSNLTAWLLTILHRLYLNDLAHHRPLSLETSAEAEPSSDSDPGLRIDMQRALARLHPDHRAVVLLVGLEQLSYAEAATVLSIPIGTVMSRLARARAQLRDLLAGTSAAVPVQLTRIK